MRTRLIPQILPKSSGDFIPGLKPIRRYLANNRKRIYQHRRIGHLHARFFSSHQTAPEVFNASLKTPLKQFMPDAIRICRITPCS